MSLKRILFVDDEVNILDGLRNVLRKQRREWDMVFAVGAAAALAEFERGAFDVIVSDMRMPGMDGAALLLKIKEISPKTVRIVLSGHAEREAVMRVLPVAHQFLSKPCDEDQLRTVVHRACALQALLHDDATRGLISGLEKLPSIPQAYWEISNTVARPNSTADDVAAVIERDPSLVAKVLQLINSAYFGLRQRVTSIRQAVQYLGFDLIKGLTLTGVFDTFKLPVADGFSLTSFQDHAMLTARVAKRLGSDPRQSEEAFTAALVHDIGQLILAQVHPERFVESRRIAAETKQLPHVIELEVLGATHAEVGAYLLGVWGLPLPIVEAAAYHHRPRLLGDGDRGVLALVHLADGLVDSACTAWPCEAALERLDLEFLAECGLTPDKRDWGALVQPDLVAAGR